MEQKSPRPAGVWHFTAHLATLLLVAAALVAQTQVGNAAAWPLLVGLLGYHGIALLGSAVVAPHGPRAGPSLLQPAAPVAVLA